MHPSRHILLAALAALGWAVQASAVTINASAAVAPATDLWGVGTSAPESYSSPSAFGTVRASVFEQDGGIFGSLEGDTAGVVDGFLRAETWVTVAYTPTPTYDATLSYGWQQTLTNSGASAVGYGLDFGIGPGSIRVEPSVPGGGSPDPAATAYAQLDLEVRQDGQTLWHSSTRLDHSGSLSESGDTLGGILQTSGPFEYSWGLLSRTLSLPALAPGDSTTVEYLVTLSSGGTNPNLSDSGYSAGINLDFPGGPGVSISAVPLPPALGLFAAGLALLVGRAHRPHR